MPSPSPKEVDSRLSDRLPGDWKKRVAAYKGNAAAHYKRVLKKLAAYDWMSQDERERAAFVIVEKEQLREQGIVIDDDD
ncbi:hypothetical protein K2Y11_01105 [bacterium]|jgi:hypothetical protein|nr:hypothetical protein [bacterium]